MIVVKLDASQSEFLNLFRQELNKDETDILILTGSAGTGKTQLIKESIDFCRDNGIGSQCLAFTGRAASVLRERGINNAKTIDSWFYSNLSSEKSLENISSPTEKFVLFIDESSMISNGAIVFENNEPEIDFKLDELIYTTLRYLPFKKTLLVFVGDENQLPPLKHMQIPALSEDYFKSRYNLNAKKYTLKTIYRQKKDSGILKLADKFKNNELDGKIEIPKIKDLKSYAEFIKENDVLDIFFESFVEDQNQIKIITSTNQLSDSYNYEIKMRLSSGENKYIKDHQIQNKILAPEVGDKLQIFKNYNKQFDVPLYNGQFVQIVELGEVKEVILTNQKQGNQEFLLPFLHQDLIIDIIDQTGKLSGNPFEITISIDHLINSFNLTKEEFDTFDKNGVDLMTQVRNNIVKETGDRSVFVNSTFNPVLAKYGYAITGHKAQGGGWKNIIIDFDGFSDETGHLPPSWIYTAVTRAKSNLFILNYPEATNE